MARGPVPEETSRRATGGGCLGVRLDPNTHAYVLATAFFTSLAFAIFAMHVLALVLGWLLA
jgi:hypothetical protein